jgi:hypothetical protein
MTKYERRREIIELRTIVVGLNKTFPGILASDDVQRIRKLATCENKRYLLNLVSTFAACANEKAFKEYLNNYELSEQLRTTINTAIRDL